MSMQTPSGPRYEGTICCSHPDRPHPPAVRRTTVTGSGGRIKVVHIVGTLGRGGTERLVLDLLTRLDRERLDLEIWALSGVSAPEVADAFERSGIRVRALSGGWTRGRLPGLWRLLMRRKPDIVHTHYYDANLYARLAAIMANIPLVMTYDHSFPIGERARHRLAWRVLNLRTAANVVVSRTVARYRIERCRTRSDKVVLIWNGIDAARFRSNAAHHVRREARAALGIPDGALVVGTVGRFVACKRQWLLVEAGAKLRRTHDIHVLIVGEGNEKANVCAAARRLDVADRVHLVGWCDQPEHLYPAMDVFAMLSTDNEGFGLATAEAMAAGVPVLAADESIHREVVTDRCGIFVSPTAEGVAAGIAHLSDRPQLARELAHNAAERARRCFDINRAAQQLQTLYLDASARLKGHKP